MKKLLLTFSLFIMSLSIFAQRQVIYSPEIESAANNGDAEAQYIMGCLLTTEGIGTPLDEARGVELLKKSAASECPMGIWQLGMSYHGGLGVAKDEAKASELFKSAISGLKKLAKKDNALAKELLAEAYSGGYGIDKDDKKAVETFTEAAEAGNALAMRNLFQIYYEGKIVAENKALAREWLKKAMDAGDPVSTCWLAEFLETGQGGFAEDQKTAMALYQKAATAGHPYAMNELAKYYDNGYLVDQDSQKALEWYLKASEYKNAEAMCSIGVHYAEGDGVEKNVKKALEWYTKAAELGNGEAMNYIGVLYGNGDEVEEDLKKANEWYMKAVKAGSASGMYNLAKNLMEGNGIEESMPKAIALLQKSVELGNTDAMGELGYCYENGEGVKEDLKMAATLYLKAAEADNGLALGRLGVMLANGNYFKKDYKKAEEYLLKAIDSGDNNCDWWEWLAVVYDDQDKYMEANKAYLKSIEQNESAYSMNMYAYHVINGKGVSEEILQDEKKLNQLYITAVEYLKKAADNGNTSAMLNLWDCYRSGKGVPVDLEKAMAYLKQAKDAGNEDAPKFIEMFEDELRVSNAKAQILEKIQKGYVDPMRSKLLSKKYVWKEKQNIAMNGNACWLYIVNNLSFTANTMTKETSRVVKLIAPGGGDGKTIQELKSQPTRTSYILVDGYIYTWQDSDYSDLTPAMRYNSATDVVFDKSNSREYLPTR